MDFRFIPGTAWLILALSLTSLSAQTRCDFEIWLADLRREALSNGISPATVNVALKDLSPIPRVIELDRNQLEFTMTLEEYLNLLVTESRVNRGREKLAEYRALLEDIEQRYGVQQRFLMALWGIETDYGRLMGDYPVIGATATLAFDGRRSGFFRGELLHALRILEQGHISADKMIGSWAGAMGQFHFLPSSFHGYAVDYEGDGRKDMWNNLGDAFASAANYLSRFGWIKEETWGREVLLPKEFDPALVGLKMRKPLVQWQRLGVRQVGGGEFPERPETVTSLVRPDGRNGQSFLVYRNYRVILDWNRSELFGIAVGTLADRLGDQE
jgi:membrane-bound lytic murein transglycosylase B